MEINQAYFLMILVALNLITGNVQLIKKKFQSKTRQLYGKKMLKDSSWKNIIINLFKKNNCNNFYNFQSIKYSTISK